MTDSQIDGAVLSSIEPRWQKVAMVISRAAKKLYGDLPTGEDAYGMIAKRIEFLIESGRPKSQRGETSMTLKTRTMWTQGFERTR
jgi:hypothetical protein